MTENIQESQENLPEIRNAKWNDSEHTSFDIELNHPEFGWIPYGVADGDSPETYCYKIWSIKDTLEIEEYQEPEIDLEELKQEKLNELTTVSDKFEQNKCDEMYITSSLGFRVNADRRSVQNLENLIRIGETTELKDYDNQFQTVTVDDLETILIEVSKNGANLYRQKFTMQYQIANLTTIEEVQNFEIQFSMLDFSQV